MSEPIWDAELEFAVRLAQAAGDATLDAFRRGSPQTEAKADGSLVTETDRATEQYIRQTIEQRFSDDGFFGEEFEPSEGTSGRRWIADPIDGTFSFVSGVPLYGTLLALEVDGDSKVGVIHMPALGETVYAAEGLGCWWSPQNEHEPRRTSFRECDTLERALLCITDPQRLVRDGLFSASDELSSSVAAVRGWSDCYAHVLCATGRCDLVVEPIVSPWDIAPMTVISREAGGRCTDWDNNETAHGGKALISGGTIHDRVLGILNAGQRQSAASGT